MDGVVKILSFSRLAWSSRFTELCCTKLACFFRLMFAGRTSRDFSTHGTINHVQLIYHRNKRPTVSTRNSVTLNRLKTWLPSLCKSSYFISLYKIEKTASSNKLGYGIEQAVSTLPWRGLVKNLQCWLRKSKCKFTNFKLENERL